MENINQEIMYIAINLFIIAIIYLLFVMKHGHQMVYGVEVASICMTTMIISFFVLIFVPNAKETGCIINKNTYIVDAKDNGEDSTCYVFLNDSRVNLYDGEEKIKETLNLFKNDSISGFCTINLISVVGQIYNHHICTKQKYDSLKALGYYEFTK